MIAQIFNSSLISGPETLVLPNLKHLREDSCVIWLREERKETEQNAAAEAYFRRFADVHVIPVRGRIDRRAASELRRTLERLQARVAHAHDVKATWMLAQTGPGPYWRLSTHHGIHARSGWLVKAYEKFYSHTLLPRMDRALAVCSSDAELLKRRGLPPVRVAVHRNGVDRELVSVSDRPQRAREIRARWGLAPQAREKILGLVARLAEEKDHQLALRIFERCRDLPFRVLCFGSGPLEERLRLESRRRGLEGLVEWRGYRPDIGPELAGLDGLLSFSKAEGLPINLIEAGWAGTPVFARQVDGVADLLPDARYGHVFAPSASENEIEGLFRDFLQGSHEDRSTRLQNRVQSEFSGRAWARRLEEITGPFAPRS